MKNIKTTQIDQINVRDLQPGMVTPDGVVLEVRGQFIDYPLGSTYVTAFTDVVPVYCRIDDEALATTIEAVREQRSGHLLNLPEEEDADNTDFHYDIEIVDIHYEVEFRFDENQPWTTETHLVHWNDIPSARAWVARWRPDVQHRIVEVQRTPVQP